MNEETNVYFKENFTLGPGFKTNFTVSLTSKSIAYESDSLKTKQIINLADIIGASARQLHTSSDNESAYIHIYSYPLKKRVLSTIPRRQRLEYVFAVSGRENSAGNLAIAEKWVRCIKWLLVKGTDINLATTREDNPPREQFLIIINPFGGKGTAMNLFQKKVEPMLEEADVQYEKLVTEYIGHAKEFVKNMNDLKKFDCIVCCSGDGIINEVINGFMSRPDWQEAIKTPVGHIPCGSGNGLCASSLYHSGEPFDMISSIFTILRGEECPLDIVKVQTPEVHYSFLCIVFGIVSDVDIESEKYRKVGDLRFSVMALKKIIEKPTFSGKLSYLSVENVDSSNGGTSICNSRTGETGELSDGATCKEHCIEEQRNLENGKLEDDILKDGNLSNGEIKDGNLDDGQLKDGNVCDGQVKDGNLSNGEIKDGNLSNGEIKDGNLSNGEIKDGNLDDGQLKDGNLSNGVLNDGTLEMSKSSEQMSDLNCEKLNNGDCHSNASNGVLGNDNLASGIANKFLPNFHEPIPESWKVIEGDFVGWLFINTTHIGKTMFCAPDGSFGDGVIHCMCLGAEMSRSDLLNTLGRMESGEHGGVHGVNMFKAHAFRIEPVSATSDIITIDGEALDWGKLQAEVYGGLGRVRCCQPTN